MPRITFTSAALRDYKKLPQQFVERVNQAIDALESDPFPTNHRKLKRADFLYRIRAGEHRVVYEYVEGAEELTVTRIRHRKDVYR